MLRRLVWFATLFALSTGCLSSPSRASEDEEPEYFADLIHSDVPLWGTGDNVWPQGFTDEDSFGCASRVALGHWHFVDYDGWEEWWRLSNYGVFHCAAVEYRGDERSELADGFSNYAFFIELGTTKSDGKVLELWAIQSGTRPGSTYTLLAADPEQEGTIRSFSVLQVECPAGHQRKGPSLDIWMSRYCAINSKSELVRLAKRMAKRPPLGQLQFVDSVGTPDSEEEANAD